MPVHREFCKCSPEYGNAFCGQAVGLADGDATRILSEDFGETLSDMSGDEDELRHLCFPVDVAILGVSANVLGIAWICHIGLQRGACWVTLGKHSVTYQMMMTR